MNRIYRFFHNLINARNNWLSTPLYKSNIPLRKDTSPL